MFLLNHQVHEGFCNHVYRFISVGHLLETRTYPCFNYIGYISMLCEYPICGVKVGSCDLEQS
jgi:hypothetical protein